MNRLIECVPNFSEGNDMKVIEQITNAIKSVAGISLLNVDPGKATNRTVVTFVGEPEAVLEAAFLGVKRAAEVIDMRHHHGAHPRMGATDVLPLIPIAGISMAECAELARTLGKRIGEELGIPVYAYESAALRPERKNLAVCRSGEYEGLPARLGTENGPDFGPNEWNEAVSKTGATACGARNFLVAYNVNLNTTSTRRANAIAFDVRERGRVKREGNPITGKAVKDENGKNVMIPGTLKSVKAIGWYIEEYGIAQISMNLTDITVCSIHRAFEEVCDKAAARGIRVTGSELVGLVPLQSLLEAGRYFLRKQQRSLGVSDAELIKIAVKSLGLDELAPFEPRKRVIEYIMEDELNAGKKRLVDMTVRAFVEETASESPAPGGGSIAALSGAMGAALGTMVANLSAHKRGWDDRWEFFSDWAEKGKAVQTELLAAVDKDTDAFNCLMDAFGLPKKSDAEKEARHKAIQEATLLATEVPLHTMELCNQVFPIAKAMVEQGLPASLSDAGVAALSARSGALGALFNVRINAASLDDKERADILLAKAQHLADQAIAAEQEILSIINTKL